MGVLNKREYQKLSKEDQKEWDKIDLILGQVRELYNVKNAFKPQIQKFQLVNSKLKPSFFKSWKVSDGTHHFTLCLIEYGTSYEEISNKYSSKISTDFHKYFFGYISSQKNFGRTLFRPETIADKISEFFQSVEIDIEGEPKFSSKYYILSNDETKFFDALDTPLLTYLRDEKTIELEFFNKKGLFRLTKAIDLNETLDLCRIGIGLHGALN